VELLCEEMSLRSRGAMAPAGQRQASSSRQTVWCTNSFLEHASFRYPSLNSDISC
jgi:hypothetical protein